MSKKKKILIVAAIIVAWVLLFLVKISVFHVCRGSRWEVGRKATCTTDGMNVLVCSCGKAIETEAIPALGHDIQQHEAKEPTCTEIGWKEYFACTRCDYNNYIERAQFGHEYVNDVCEKCGIKLKLSEGLAYTLNSDSQSYSVSGIGTCIDTDLVIPSSHEGKSVVSIDSYAFSECTTLKSVTIPYSVKKIGAYAFQYCRSIESMVIPYSVKSISDGMFKHCGNLKSITIPDSVTSICDYAFYGCKSLESVTIPESVASVCDYAFYGCTALKKAVMSNGLLSMGAFSFAECTSLESVKMSESIVTIKSYSFYNCKSLKSVVIPGKVTMIDKCAFSECSSLRSVTIPTSMNILGYRCFENCIQLSRIYFNGTKDKWEKMKKASSWRNTTGNYTVYCSGGNIPKSKDRIANYYFD